ncbi:MAG: response regulator transcription factor [Actinomycetota bacterium]|nr:response regulator transcription factor [Actinomycetota bacterium]
MGARVLVVEDDEVIGRGLVQALRSQGYSVELSTSGEQALVVAGAGPLDLVLLDLGLPDLDGVEVCRRLRVAQPTVAVIMITARREEVDIVVGLDAGAVDYVAKPFRLAELLARVRVHLRQADSDGPGRIGVGDLEIDVAAHRAWRGGHELDLRPKEFDLLALLMAEAGRVVTRERIMAEVWDEHWYGSTKTLDMHVVSLRRKLGPLAKGPGRICTVRGVGYRLESL